MLDLQVGDVDVITGRVAIRGSDSQIARAGRDRVSGFSSTRVLEFSSSILLVERLHLFEVLVSGINEELECRHFRRGQYRSGLLHFL